jgi:signal transduction histidine kinase
MIVGSGREERMSSDTEERLTQFTELLATAVANAGSRAELARLAEEQTALRRVATLVAQSGPPVDVFAAVAEEVGGLLPAYFVISEALTNVVKHARASGAAITAQVRGGQLRVEVRDDGIGGAGGGPSSGLGGLEDRVAALNGRLVLESPSGGGRRVCALLPVSGEGWRA